APTSFSAVKTAIEVVTMAPTPAATAATCTRSPQLCPNAVATAARRPRLTPRPTMTSTPGPGTTINTAAANENATHLPGSTMAATLRGGRSLRSVNKGVGVGPGQEAGGDGVVGGGLDLGDVGGVGGVEGVEGGGGEGERVAEQGAEDVA